MGLGKGAGLALLLLALGRSAPGAGPQAREVWRWPEAGARDPLEFGPPAEDLPPAPQPPRKSAAEFALEAEDLLAKGDLDGAERLVETARAVLRASGREDAELEARLDAVTDRIQALRAEAETAKAVRRLRLELGAVAWSRKNPVALVNGEVCRPGDVVEGARIENILPGEVIFVFNGARIRKSVLRPDRERAGDLPAAGGPGKPE